MRTAGTYTAVMFHVGMDYAPFKKPSCLAGLFSYRSVIPPSPHKTLLCKLSWGPRPTGQGGERYQFHHANSRRNGLRSIQKAQPFGWAFLIPLRHSSFSPQNFAVQTFVGTPPYGPRRGAGINFITQTHVKSYILRNQSVAFSYVFI